MDPRSNKHLTRAAGIAGFLAMSVVGWKWAGASGSVSDAGDGAGFPAVAAHHSSREVRIPGPPASVSARMAAVRAAGSAAERTLATIALAEALAESEIAAWLDDGWFNLRDGSDLTVFTRILERRWLAGDSAGYLQWCSKRHPGKASEVLASWADDEPQRVLGYFKNHPDHALELEALADMARNHPALALEGFLEMTAAGFPGNNPLLYSDAAEKLFQQLARSAPEALEAALDSVPKSLRTTAEVALIGQRMLTSFPEELRKLWQRPDGEELFSYVLNHPDGIGDRMLDELANLPPHWRKTVATCAYTIIGDSDPEKWCGADLPGMGFTVEQTNQIRGAALSLLAATRPQLAFELMDSLDLADNRHNPVVQIALIRANPGQAESLVELLDSAADREYARSVLDSIARQQAEAPVVVDTPAEWLEKISTLDPDTADFHKCLSAPDQWDQQQLAGLSGQFSALSDDRKLRIAKALLGFHSFSLNYDTALMADVIRYAIARPDPSNNGWAGMTMDRTRQVCEFAVNWVKTDPSAASQWVQDLPDGDAKTWALGNVASVWAQYDPKQAGQWVNSLPGKARAGIGEFIKKGDRTLQIGPK